MAENHDFYGIFVTYISLQMSYKNGPFFVLSSVYVAVISPVLLYHFSHLHHKAHFIDFETEQTKIRQLL